MPIALWALYVVWALIIAQKKDDTSLQAVHWGFLLFSAVLYLANVIPSFL
jgi:hypothetical protein